MDEIKVLTDWCTAHAMRWHPVSAGRPAAVLLEPQDSHRCWERMVLWMDDEDFRLATEEGDPLASASDLHSVLDALEGGVAESVFCTPLIRQTAETAAGFVI